MDLKAFEKHAKNYGVIEVYETAMSYLTKEELESLSETLKSLDKKWKPPVRLQEPFSGPPVTQEGKVSSHKPRRS